MTEKEIKISGDSGQIEIATIRYDQKEKQLTEVTLELQNEKQLSATGTDVFMALRALRETTEKQGITLLINGCRPECWPSGMSAQMSNGLKIYQRSLNNMKGWKPVNTLDYAPIDHIGTLNAQNDFNNKLREKLK